MLLSNALLDSAVEDNLMLKGKFVIPGMITSSLPKFRKLSRSNWFWSIWLGLWVTITFCLVHFMPLVGHSQGRTRIQLFFCIPFLGCHQMWRTMVIPVSSVMSLSFWSIILWVREVNFSILSLLYQGVTGSKLINSSKPVIWHLIRMLLSLLFSRLSVLLSSSKLKSISATCANLSILTMLSLVSSGVVITFLPIRGRSSSLPQRQWSWCTF